MNLLLLVCSFIVMIIFTIGVKLNQRPSAYGGFGYKTKVSMRSEETWHDGNVTFGRYLMMIAPLQIAVLVATERYLPEHPYRIFTVLAITTILSITIAYLFTQNKLRTIYFKDGKRRPNSF
ncbi:MAG: SdpI family protein [Bacteroidota bacterium]